MKICLDTNAYTEIIRNPKSKNGVFILESLEQAAAIFLPVVVFGELLAGFRLGDREKRNRENLEDFFQNFQVRILEATRETAEWYALFFMQARSQGKMIPSNDLWIVALTAQAGARLLTLDKHFGNLSETLVLSPD